MKAASKLKTNFKAIFLAASITVGGLGVHQSVNAYVLPVADVLNFSNHTITSIQQYLDTAQEYLNVYHQTLQTWNEITTFDVASVFLDSEQKAALMAFINTGRNVHGAVRKTQDVYNNLQTAFATSPFSQFEDFLKDFQRRKDHGDQLAKTLYDSAMVAEDELKRAHDQHMRVVNEMPAIHGVTEAAKATAQSVGVLIQQNQGIVQLMAAQSRIQGQELQREYNERAQNEKNKSELLEAQKKAIQRDAGLLRSIR